MQWDFKLEHNTLVVKITGEFDLALADKIRSELDNTIDTAEVRHVIFNFADVNYIDSSGLGVILGRYKRLSRYGGKMAIIKPQPQVRKIIELSGLLTIIAEYNDEAEALEKIG